MALVVESVVYKQHNFLEIGRVGVREAGWSLHFPGEQRTGRHSPRSPSSPAGKTLNILYILHNCYKSHDVLMFVEQHHRELS